jgi:hypothetical protein
MLAVLYRVFGTPADPEVTLSAFKPPGSSLLTSPSIRRSSGRDFSVPSAGTKLRAANRNFSYDDC